MIYEGQLLSYLNDLNNIVTVRVEKIENDEVSFTVLDKTGKKEKEPLIKFNRKVRE